MGKIRREELLNSCMKLFHIARDDVYIIDHVKLQDGMSNIWCIELIAEIVLQHIKMIQPNIVSYMNVCVCMYGCMVLSVYMYGCMFGCMGVYVCMHVIVYQ